MNDIDATLELNALFEDLAPMASKKVAVVIGRFNPPTRGHYEVINAVKKFIREHKNLGLEATPAVVIIGGGKTDADKKRNPLSVEEREVFMKASGKANGVLFFTAPNAFAAFGMLRDKGYEPVAIAAGTDRIEDYYKMLNKYFTTPDGSPIEHHKIHLERDADAAGSTDKDSKSKAMDSALTSMKDGQEVDTDVVSASLARRAVELGYEPEFAKIVGLEDKPALAKKMFDKVKAAIGGTE